MHNWLLPTRFYPKLRESSPAPPEMNLSHPLNISILSRVGKLHRCLCVNHCNRTFISSTSAAASASTMGCKLGKYVGGHKRVCHLCCAQQEVAQLHPAELICQRPDLYLVQHPPLDQLWTPLRERFISSHPLQLHRET